MKLDFPSMLPSEPTDRDILVRYKTLVAVRKWIEEAFIPGWKLPNEIIRLMDGALASTESVSRYFYADTPLSQEDKVLTVFQEIRDYISSKLEAVTLADLV